jgi:hypothetical protein
MRSRLVRMGSFLLGLMILTSSIGVSLLAQQRQAPEIDGGTITAGLGLVTAGFLIVRSRFRSK